MCGARLTRLGVAPSEGLFPRPSPAEEKRLDCVAIAGPRLLLAPLPRSPGVLRTVAGVSHMMMLEKASAVIEAVVEVIDSLSEDVHPQQANGLWRCALQERTPGMSAEGGFCPFGRGRNSDFRPAAPA